jgi:hypothetical protein
VVTVPTGGCVVVSVPRSPFRAAATTPTGVVPSGVLVLVSDTLHPNGSRTASYRARAPGTVVVSSTVDLHSGATVPRWSGIVHSR